jgi:hypothetical protein
MIRDTRTNIDKYSLPESHVQRANTGEGSRVPDEEPIALASRILKYPLPEWLSMNDVYIAVAKQLPLPDGVNASSDLSRTERMTSFDAAHDLDALSRAHQEARDSNPKELTTDFWPEGENVEDFIDAALEGRYEKEEDDPDS